MKMKKKKGLFLVLAMTVLLTISLPAAGKNKPIIGDSVGSYNLAPENQDVIGMTFDEISKEAPRLFVLDKSGKIFVYGLDKEDSEGFKGFSLKETIDLPAGEDGQPRRVSLRVKYRIHLGVKHDAPAFVLETDWFAATHDLTDPILSGLDQRR